MSCSRPALAYIATNCAASSPASPSRAASVTPYASVHTDTASPCLRRLSPFVHSSSNSSARSRECSPLIESLPSLPAYMLVLHPRTSNRGPRTCLLPWFHFWVSPVFFGNSGQYPLTLWLPSVTLGTSRD